MVKRLMALLLSLVMTVSLLPVQSFGAEAETESLEALEQTPLDLASAPNLEEMIAAGFGDISKEETEPNNDPQHATYMTNGVTMSGMVTAKDMGLDKDYLSFVLKSNSLVSLYGLCAFDTMDVFIRNEGGKILEGTSYLPIVADGMPGFFISCTLEAGVYTIELTDTEQLFNTYDIFLKVTECAHTNMPGIAVEATCTQGDGILYTCKDCGYSRLETYGAPLGHNAGSAAVTKPTCTEQGYTLYSCTRCSHTWKDQYVPKLGHTKVTDAAVAATCTSPGLTEGSHCSLCGKILTAQQKTPLADHTLVTEGGVAPTCTETGLTDKVYCSVCGKIQTEQAIIPALGHTAVVTIPGEMPTCEEPGLTEQTECSVCGQVLTVQQKAPAAGHTVVLDPAREATCAQDGATAGSHCTVCGKVLKAQTVIPALPHTEVIEPAEEPTCKRYGFTEGSHCAVCGKILKYRDTIPNYNIEHTIVVDIPDVKATCTESGRYGTSHCAVCGKTFGTEKEIKPYGHNYVNGVCRRCGKNVSDWTWSLDGTTLTITGTGDMDDYVDGNPPWGHDIQTVIVEEGITSIGVHAFSWSRDLREVVLPSTLTSIDMSAFEECNALTDIVLPEGLTSIGANAFEACRGLTEFALPGSLRDIRPYAFSRCINLTDIILPEGIAAINDHVFYGCNKLRITIPDSVTRIEAYAFSGCNELDDVVIPDSVTSIGAYAFSGCKSLSNLKLPGGILEIRERTFSGCAALETVVIPEGVTEIEASAFRECSSLRSVVFPETLIKIKRDAFRDCTSLEEVRMPASLNHLEECVFTGCSSLRKVTFAGDVPASFSVNAFYGATVTICYSSNYTGWRATAENFALDNITWEKCAVNSGSCGKNLTWSLDESTGTVTISGTGEMDGFDGPEPELCRNLVVEEGVTSIARGAFSGYTQLRSVTLPDSLARIEPEAFEGCKSLTGITLPDGLIGLGYYAFDGCTGLTDVKFTGKAPEIIGTGGGMDYPFGHSSVYAVAWYPGDDPSYTEEVRYDLGHSLDWKPYYSQSGTCGKNLTWSYDPDGKTLTISGTGDMEDYPGAGAAPWSGLGTELETIRLEAGVTGIGTHAFHGCSNLKELVLPKTLIRIGGYAFHGCSSLTAVTLPEKTDSLGAAAFARCTGLKEIIFPADAPGTIGELAFYQVTAKAYYPGDNRTWTKAVRKDYGGDLTWVPSGKLENRILMDAADLNGETSVWIDGVEYPVERMGDESFVDLADSHAKTMVVYTYRMDDPEDLHTRYPVGMKVWLLSNDEGFYTLERAEQLDNVLQYAGMSIRVTGRKGIRMITAVEQSKKRALTSGGLEGCKLKEYGTVIAWADQLKETKPLVLGKSYTKSNHAYKKGAADPVFAVDGSRMQYTNVLVGFSQEQCGTDIAMRSYMILEDAKGEERILYGGIVTRSIGYIAWQNRNAFASGTEAYEYVWDIIRSVYGEGYKG